MSNPNNEPNDRNDRHEQPFINPRLSQNPFGPGVYTVQLRCGIVYEGWMFYDGKDFIMDDHEQGIVFFKYWEIDVAVMLIEEGPPFL